MTIWRSRSAVAGLALLAAVGAPGALVAQQSSFKVEWGSNATEYRGQHGRRVTVVCPPGGGTGAVYGTDVYTDDSQICPAAVHAGRIGFAGGVVTLVFSPGESVYHASTRNGIASRSFGAWDGSYRFDTTAAPGQVEWTTTASGIPAQHTINVLCPAGDAAGRVWGTDTYTDDSSICSAALHAGIITAGQGGAVALRGTGAQPSYVGSSRNGVASDSYQSWPNSFTVSAPVAAPAPTVLTGVGTPAPRTTVVPAAASVERPAPATGTTVRMPPMVSTPASLPSSEPLGRRPPAIVAPVAPLRTGPPPVTGTPMQPEVAIVGLPPRTMTAPHLTLVGTYIAPLTLRAPALELRGTFIPALTLRTTPLTLVGTYQP